MVLLLESCLLSRAAFITVSSDLQNTAALASATLLPVVLPPGCRSCAFRATSLIAGLFFQFCLVLAAAASPAAIDYLSRRALSSLLSFRNPTSNCSSSCCCLSTTLVLVVAPLPYQSHSVGVHLLLSQLLLHICSSQGNILLAD